MKTEDLLKALTNVGFQPVTETPAQFAAFLVTDRANAAKRIEAASLKME
jgi:tripartite-type tricarboxylate transporter receptor subunit TctC